MCKEHVGDSAPVETIPKTWLSMHFRDMRYSCLELLKANSCKGKQTKICGKRIPRLKEHSHV